VGVSDEKGHGHMKISERYMDHGSCEIKKVEKKDMPKISENTSGNRDLPIPWRSK